jgi:hypothetical protein
MSEIGDAENFGPPPGPSNGEEYYFEYSAALRIFGRIRDLDAITEQLGVVPTHVHRKGDSRGITGPHYEHDMWMYTVPVSRTEPLHVHIDTLWKTLRGHKQYLLLLKHDLKVDVFLGYRTNCDTAGVQVPYQSLEMFGELEMVFGLSIIIA